MIVVVTTPSSATSKAPTVASPAVTSFTLYPSSGTIVKVASSSLDTNLVFKEAVALSHLVIVNSNLFTTGATTGSPSEFSTLTSSFVASTVVPAGTVQSAPATTVPIFADSVAVIDVPFADSPTSIFVTFAPSSNFTLTGALTTTFVTVVLITTSSLALFTSNVVTGTSTFTFLVVSTIITGISISISIVLPSASSFTTEAISFNTIVFIITSLEPIAILAVFFTSILATVVSPNNKTRTCFPSDLSVANFPLILQFLNVTVSDPPPRTNTSPFISKSSRSTSPSPTVLEI